MMERRGSGSAGLDGMGTSGAPMTPRRRRRSERRNEPLDPPGPPAAAAAEEAMDGVRVRWPEPLAAAGVLGVGVTGGEALGVGPLDERRQCLPTGVQTAEDEEDGERRGE